MAKKSTEEIIRKEKPGYHLAVGLPADNHDEPIAQKADATSRSLEQLKRKYLGPGAGLDEAIGAAATKQGVQGGAFDDDVQIVAVEPDAPATDAEPPRRTKAVVVSRSKGKVIGEQG